MDIAPFFQRHVLKLNETSPRWDWALQGLRRLVPPQCWGCQRWMTERQQNTEAYPFVCVACLKKLAWTNPETCCPKCGQTTEAHGLSCPDCPEAGFHFNQVWAGFCYETQIQQWILQFKYGKKEQMAPFLGRLLAISLAQYVLPAADGIVPIPLHRKRLQERGFNQALLLAHHTFGEKHLVKTDWLQRIRATSPQAELSASQRVRNMQDAFWASPQVNGKQVVLMDDVFTTGATLNAAAQVLKAAGADSVHVIVLARRMLPEPFSVAGFWD